MKRNRLDAYSLTASIHTVTLRSTMKPNLPKTVDSRIIRSSSYMQKAGVWHLTINPNKLHGDIMAYSEFCATMYELCREMQIENPVYYRCDIRLDSYANTFKAYFKLNLLLISLLSIQFNDPNDQAVSHLLACSKSFTDISTQNSYWEAKYYDRGFLNDTDPAKARLEFRCLRTTKKGGYAPHEIKEKWFERFKKIPSLYAQLQERCNENLQNAYEKYKAYNSKSDTQKDYLTNFLSVYSNSMTIFTREQLRAFLMKCGLKDTAANSRADYIIDRVFIELFSKADIERYIKKIKDAMDDFFEC